MGDRTEGRTAGLGSSPSSAAFAAAFAPRKSVLFIAASEMNGVQGSANISGTNRHNAWLIATSERVGKLITLPEGWATYDIALYWYNAGAGSGNVSWRTIQNQAVAADNVSSSGSTGPQASIVTASAQNILVVSMISTGLAVPAAGAPITFTVDRFATGDTLANDVGLIGVKLTAATFA